MSTKKVSTVNDTKSAESEGLDVLTKNNIAPKKKTVIENDGFCVYIGPTIIGVIQSGTVYRGKKSDVLKTIAAAVEKYPLIASLVVTDKTIAKDRIKVNIPGNLLYVNYHKLIRGKE